MGLGTAAAVIGGVVGIGSSILGSKAQKEAAGQAADASEAAAAAQLQLGREGLAFNRDIYNANFGILSPFVSRGNVAGNQINALLGLPNAPTMTSPLAVSASANPSAPTGYTGPSLSQIMAMQHDGIDGNFQPALEAYNRAMSAPQPAPVQPQRQAPRANAQPSANSAQSALTQFSNSAGMKFAQQEGANTINMGAAGNGWLQSGAALEALQQRGQDIALQQYFPMYLGALQGQQGTGVQAGGAVAGVGVNAANTAAGINGQMGNAIGNNAANIGNLALANGQNRANMWANLGSSFGDIVGEFK